MRWRPAELPASLGAAARASCDAPLLNRWEEKLTEAPRHRSHFSGCQRAWFAALQITQLQASNCGSNEAQCFAIQRFQQPPDMTIAALGQHDLQHCGGTGRAQHSHALGGQHITAPAGYTL